MATNDAIGFVELESNLTVSTAMNGTSLMSLSKVLKKKDILKALSFFINRFNDNFNAKGKLNNMQIATMSGDLFEILKYETLEDAMLMFKYARQGKIGDGKDFKLDSQTVFHKWVPALLELKAIEREKEHAQNKEEIKQFTTKDFDSKVAIKIFENIGSEKIEHNNKGCGLGARYRKELQKAKVVTNRTDYLSEIRKKAKETPIGKLKTYLLKNDSNSEYFDPQVYEIVENEIDKRNTKCANTQTITHQKPLKK